MHNKQGNNEKRFCTCGPSPSQVGDLDTLAHGESHLPATLSLMYDSNLLEGKTVHSRWVK